MPFAAAPANRSAVESELDPNAMSMPPATEPTEREEVARGPLKNESMCFEYAAEMSRHAAQMQTVATNARKKSSCSVSPFIKRVGRKSAVSTHAQNKLDPRVS